MYGIAVSQLPVFSLGDAERKITVMGIAQKSKMYQLLAKRVWTLILDEYIPIQDCLISYGEVSLFIEG